MSLIDHKNFLRVVLFVDAATCVATGLTFSVGAGPLTVVTHLPIELLRYAGICLFPIGAFILLIASRPQPPTIGVWAVILGNVGWVLASLALMIGDVVTPSGFGYVVIGVQAAAVAVLANLEYLALRRSGQGAMLRAGA